MAARSISLATTGWNDRLVLRAITDEVMYELAKLSGQEYVDDYAANRKSGLAAKAENIVAASMLQTAAAAAKAESLIAASRAQTAAVVARAEGVVAASRAQAAERAGSIIEAARTRATSAAPVRQAKLPAAPRTTPRPCWPPPIPARHARSPADCRGRGRRSLLLGRPHVRAGGGSPHPQAG